MSPDAWVVIIGAAGTQVAGAIQAWRTGKVVRKTAEAVGEPNGLGPVHEALSAIDKRLTDLCVRVGRLEIAAPPPVEPGNGTNGA